MAKHLSTHGELLVGKEILEKLARVSVSTLKRILKQVQHRGAKLAMQQPRRPQMNHLRKQYPMHKIAWDIPEAGHFEVALVHHGVETAQGEYIHTLQMVDIATGWSEIVAIFGRSYRVMADGFDYVLARLPFEVREIHPGNGAEFFN
jgi:hypothetical protein